jgi:hypothetical protein
MKAILPAPGTGILNLSQHFIASSIAKNDYTEE